MSRSRIAALAAVLVVPIAAGGFLVHRDAAPADAHLLDQVMTLVANRYVDTLPHDALYEKAARGLVHELNDPYAALYSPKQFQEFTAQTGGHYGGLGMLVEDQEGAVVVSRVYPHTPAEAGGVHEGDHIVGVGTQSTRGWTLSKVTDVLKGVPGSPVTVSFERAGTAAPIRLHFTRAIIHIPAVPYSMMLRGHIGYVPLLQFNETAAAEMRAAVQRLVQHGAKGLIVDLRGNGGGIVDQAIGIGSLFLPNGEEIATVRDRGGDVQRYTSEGAPMAPKIPLIVMVDGYTASASEIVTGALQDHDRALVLGTTSFGKGLVQSLFQLSGGWAMKLTTAKWYTPSGRSIQKERKFVDGHFVVDSTPPDSLETDSAKRNRPVYHSDAGRVVYGGGGITPDVVIRPDTLSSPEQDFLKAVSPKSQEFYVTLYNFSMSLEDSVSPSFTVTPAWRREFYTRLEKAGVTVSPALYDSAAGEVNRLLGDRIARFAFPDSVVKERELGDDVQLERALSIIRSGATQRDLFNTAISAR